MDVYGRYFWEARICIKHLHLLNHIRFVYSYI